MFRAEFYNEDGQIFYLGAFHGSLIDQLVRPYNGFIELVPRLIAAAAHLVPPYWAPVVANVLALALVAAIVRFVASERLADMIPNVWVRFSLGCLVLLLPATDEALGSMTYVQWYLAAFLLLGAFVRQPSTHTRHLGHAVAVGAAAMTGPFAILYAPVYGVRAWTTRTRHAAALFAIVVTAAAAQLAMFLFSGTRLAAAQSDPVAVIQIFGLRVLDGAFLGTHLYAVAIAIAPPAVAIIALTLVLAADISTVAWTTLTPSLRLLIGYAFGASVGSVLLVHTEELSALSADPVAEERYFMVSSMILGAIAIAGFVTRRGRPRLGAAVLTGLLLAAAVGDFRLRPHPPRDWAANSGCIGGPVPCEVPVEPPGIWTIHWPGSGGL